MSARVRETFVLRKLAIETLRSPRESQRLPRGWSDQYDEEPDGCECDMDPLLSDRPSVRSRFAFRGFFYVKRPSATSFPVSGSPRFIIPDLRSKWHRIAIRSRISELLFGSSGFLSPVTRSAVSRIPMVRPLRHVGRATETQPTNPHRTT
jgi:hypothetical protein